MTRNEFMDRVEETLVGQEFLREDLEAIVDATLNSLHNAPEECDVLLPRFVPRSRLDNI